MDGLNKVQNFVYHLRNRSVVAPPETNNSLPPASAVCTEASTPLCVVQGRSAAGEFLRDVMNDSVIGDGLNQGQSAQETGSADLATVPSPLNLGAASKDR